MRWKLLVLVALVLLVGCSHPPPVSGTLTGTITYKGQPVNGAALSLYANDASPATFLIPVTEEGTFSTTNVPPGDYKVVVDGRSGAAVGGSKGDQYASKATIPFPKKYKDVRTTTLKMTVVAGEQKQTLELTD
jgi:hypothetical protein